MHQHYIFVAALLGASLLLLVPTLSASVISCPPNNPQEASPSLRQLCFAVEQAISENAIPQDQYGRLDERTASVNNMKRQDVDHVFLRFGRRFGL